MPNCWCGKVDREAGRWSEVDGLNTIGLYWYQDTALI